MNANKSGNRTKQKPTCSDIPANSKVGIFWGYNGNILAGSTLVKDAVADGFFVNFAFGHDKYWNTIQKNCPELKLYEYDEIPRGRVIFSKEENVFLVYMDRVLFSDEFKLQILKEFDLHQSQTRFGKDAHYTTDRKKINKLLKD